MSNLYGTAIRLRKAGISVMPINMATKQPAATPRHPGGLIWSRWRDDPDSVTDEEFSQSWGSADAMAIICGKVELLDIDTDADPSGNIHDRFDAELRKYLEPRHYDRLFIERSPAGGIHYWYKVESVLRNTKLAMIEYDDADRFALDEDSAFGCIIETRGAGGYGICAPSPNYTVIQGSIDDLPTFSDDTRDIFLQVARSFNTYIQPQTSLQESTAGSSGGKRPGDVYNDTVGVEEMLGEFTSRGWRVVRKMGSKVFLNRPGAKHPMKHDADLCIRRRTFMNYSSSVAEFDAGRGYSFFSAYAVLAHGHDIKAAAKAVAASGYHADDQAVVPVGAAPEAESDILEELAHLRFSLTRKPNTEYTFHVVQQATPYRTEEEGLGFPGAMIIVSGEEKSLKTTVLTAIVAAAIRGALVLMFKFKKKCRVLWIDTEQPEFYFWRTIWKLCVQAGIEMDNDMLYCYTLMDLLPNERVDKISRLVERLKPDILVVDGIADCVWDPNDGKENIAFFDGKAKKWLKDGAMGFFVIHENKEKGGDGKWRGHTGSILARKCDGGIQSKKTGENTIQVSSKKGRGARFEAFELNVGRGGILYDKSMPIEYNFDLADHGAKEKEPVVVAPEASLDDLPF